MKGSPALLVINEMVSVNKAAQTTYREQNEGFACAKVMKTYGVQQSCITTN